MSDDKKDSDKTPIEPLMARKRSSQRAMVAIGWVDCPKCVRNGVVDTRFDCDICWDEETQSFSRRVPLDVAVKYTQDQSRKDIGHKDTEPEMPAVILDEEKKR